MNNQEITANILPRAFSPSIARDMGAASRGSSAGSHDTLGLARAAVWALGFGVVVSASYAPASAAMTRPAVSPAASPATAPVRRRNEAPATTQDMVATLKGKGMPIAAIADMLDVERKTVYSWLDDGIEANPANHERLRRAHGLLAGEAIGALRYFHRVWGRRLPEGGTLRDALMAPEIDPAAVSAALDALRPIVERNMRADAGRRVNPDVGPASSLTLDFT